MPKFAFGNYIADQWVKSDDLNKNINPSDLDDMVGAYGRASVAQTEQAIDAARAAFPAWSHSALETRLEILDGIGTELIARKDELGRLLAREEGKTLAEGTDYHVPFGGRKDSSYGPRERSGYAREFYTTVKTAYTKP